LRASAAQAACVPGTRIAAGRARVRWADPQAEQGRRAPARRPGTVASSAIAGPRRVLSASRALLTRSLNGNGVLDAGRAVGVHGVLRKRLARRYSQAKNEGSEYQATHLAAM
jgi:hypothetical protein